jgi:predicted ATPase/signal transduction histidine kinase
MFTLPGYRITEELHVGIKTLVYRGIRLQDQRPVILKTLRADYPSQKDLARLQHEYALTKDWEENGLPHTYELQRHRSTQILIQQDIGGVALSHLLADQALPLETFLTLAIAFTRSLCRIHQFHLIHKDINPSNLVVNIKTGQVQIIDFGISTQLSRETPQLQSPGHLEGTLAYLSPEQTGRMNRALDYRSDFYSLGITFYEMLAGVPPFSATDPLTLVHCHLAQTPTPLHERCPEVPPVLSELIQKMMAKTAEARYQSAFGLIADLTNCQERFLASKGSAAQRGAVQRGAVQRGAVQIAPFALGQQDISKYFQIPQKLYGRETETQQVLDAFTRVSQGESELLLVVGYSGVGKTALVHEVHKPITEKKGYFIDGKFDQFHRDIPYASLIHAFQELLRQLLGESSAAIAHWKANLEQALGSIAQVIIDVIPEVELIMGPQAPVPVLPSAQAQNRFHFALEQFIHAFTTEAHPLVLFLDDLQWADLPSLQLIKLFMTNPETRYLLIIGAYRDNEVHAAHPLMLTLEEIRNAQTKLETIQLKPLNLTHVRQLLIETFHCNWVKSQALAQLCIRKTEGNAFFLSQFLRALVEAQQISFQHKTGHWEWDMAQLQETQITNNVVDLMMAKIKALPETTQTTIRLAACIGNQFDITILTLASEQSAQSIAQSLWPALQESLIIPLDDTYKHMEFEHQVSASTSDVSDVHANSPSFKFIHDRVQQAAYALILDDAKALFHLRIGRLLLAHLPPEQREERIFDLVYHWNRGCDLLTEQKEKEALAQFNLIAGKKAKTSIAYKPALNYFETGLKLITSAGWKTHYELTLSLTVEATEAAWLCGDFERMAELAEMILQNANTLRDKVRTYQIQIFACIARNQFLEAIQMARTVLEQLGLKCPATPTQLHVAWGVVKTKLALLDKPVEDLIHLPQMTDPSALAAMQICRSMEAACYITQSKLFPLLICRQIELLTKYGNSPYAAPAYALYGVILCGGLGEIESGYRFGNLALKVFSPEAEYHLRARFITKSLLTHWKTALRDNQKPLLEIHQSALQIGLLDLACGACFMYCESLYFSGETLNTIQKELEKYTPIMIQFKQDHALALQKILEQTILDLQGHSEVATRHPTGTSYDETAPIATEHGSATFVFHLGKMMLCYLFQQYPAALEQGMAANKYLEAAISSPSVPVYHFYFALVHLALFSEAPKKAQNQILKKVAAIRKKLKKWAHHAPMNYAHKEHLVAAELARVTGNELLAMQYYDQAITLAENNAFQQEAALANELVARFNISKGRGKLARIYLRQAHAGYQQWGAVAKVRHMEAQYPDLLTNKTQNIGVVPRFGHSTTTQNTDAMNSEALDLATAMKAAQAISGEIILGNLLEKLMCLAIENAGAQRGALLLETNGEWWIEAEGNVSTNVSANVSTAQAAVSVVQSRPLMPPPAPEGTENDLPSLPVSLIQYVARSRNTLVLHDACARGQFMNNPYISQNGAKSVLCAPILHQGKLAGILYLENNLTAGAFTENRLGVLKILSAQAAISIENARVYENLESTVAQRTAALSTSNAALSQSNVALELAYSAAETAREHAESAKHQATEALNELREAQTQLVQSAKMASLGHLVGGVAHELNTPIANALITSSLLADSTNMLQTVLAEGEMRRSTLIDFVGDAVEMADLINRSCQRAATLITSFKQVAADQTSEQRRPFDLHSLVADNIAALSAGFKGALWVIKTEIPDGIECDSYPGPLGQVIANLVQNAALHAFEERASGLLKITAAIKPGANEVEMLFSDDGNGIDPAILAHIFEPFYTARPGHDQDRKQGGPGLGLSISLNIVTGVLGGTLRADSKPGCGSQFCLTFPLKAPQKGHNRAGNGFIPTPHT